MRAIGTLAMVVLTGCGSENALRGSVAPEDGVDTETSTPVGDDDDEPVPVAGTGELEGRVCAPDGTTYLALADVFLVAGDEVYRTQTDGQGFFLLTGLPAGTWNVTVEKGSFVVSHDITIEEGVRTSVGGQECVPIDPGNTDIAVVSGAYDSIEDVLDVMELDYTLYNGRNGTAYLDLLRDPSELAKYDIVFLNCGMGEQWRDHQAEINANLKDYVQQGGSIYASDWAYYLVESTWPAKNDFHGNDARFGDAAVGSQGSVSATVLDAAMIEVLDRSSANLNFDLGMWVAMVDVSPDAEVLIEGTYRWNSYGNGGTETGPLATRLHDGDGTVVFTSFHNERQATADMAKLLQEIILSL